jgi:hypothetical protein
VQIGINDKIGDDPFEAGMLAGASALGDKGTSPLQDLIPLGFLPSSKISMVSYWSLAIAIAPHMRNWMRSRRFSRLIHRLPASTK